MLSVGILECFRRVNHRDTVASGYPSRCLLNLGLLFIAAFLVRNFTVHIQSEVYLGMIRVRVLIEILAAGVIAYWMIAPDPDEATRPPLWSRIHPLFVEVLILFLVAVLIVELPTLFHPLVWGAAALVLSAIGPRLRDRVACRLDFYSLLFAWAAAVQLAAVTSTIETAKAEWYFKPWFLGTTVVLLESIYLARIHRDSFLAGLDFPDGLRWIGSLTAAIRPAKNIWIYYPLFASMAVFAYWRFGAATLTFVFVVQSFIIFILSLKLSVPHFRSLSMALLGVCLVRLVFFDMVRSGTLTRGLVFLGVGGIMMTMNVLYRKFDSGPKR